MQVEAGRRPFTQLGKQGFQEILSFGRAHTLSESLAAWKQAVPLQTQTYTSTTGEEKSFRYFSIGNGEQPLIILAGFAEGPYRYLPEAVRFADTYTAIVPDLGSFRTVAEVVEGLEQITKSQADRAMLLGISVGGTLAQHFSVKHPKSIDTMILVHTGTPDALAFAKPVFRLMKPVDMAESKWVTETYRRIVTYRPPVDPALPTANLSDDAMFSALSRFAIYDYKRTTDWRNLTNQLHVTEESTLPSRRKNVSWKATREVPHVHIVHNKRDRVVKLRNNKLRETYPQAKETLTESRYGHSAIMIEPYLTLDAIVPTLERTK